MTRPAAPGLDDRALGRAMLARQGLLERYPAGLDVTDLVSRVGAVQAQQWSAVCVGLGARRESLDPAEVHAAFAGGRLLLGTLLRSTLHVVTAADHPAYALTADSSGAFAAVPRAKVASPGTTALRAALVTELAARPERPLTAEGNAAFAEDWVARHPGAMSADELDHERRYGWRPLRRCSDLVRTPEDRVWGARTPEGFGAAPEPPSLLVGADREERVRAAVEGVLLAHLRSYGPAGVDDMAAWTGLRPPVVRAALARLDPAPDELSDSSGRVLHDLPGAPRPDPRTPAPVRLLPWFDGTLLGYAPARRGRVLADEHRDAVYSRANLQVRPTLLVDGRVAGVWSVRQTARSATVTVQPFARPDRATSVALEVEAAATARLLAPEARDHRVEVLPA